MTDKYLEEKLAALKVPETADEKAVKKLRSEQIKAESKTRHDEAECTGKW